MSRRPNCGCARDKNSRSSLFQLSHQGATGPTHIVAGIVAPVCRSSRSLSLIPVPTPSIPQNRTPRRCNDTAIFAVRRFRLAGVGSWGSWCPRSCAPRRSSRDALVNTGLGGRVGGRTRQRRLGGAHTYTRPSLHCPLIIPSSHSLRSIP